MALIKCPECGKEISDKAKICPHCGINLNEDPNNNTHTNIVCPHCKKIFVGFKNNNPKCPYCGHKIVEQQKNLSKKHKFGLIIGSMVIFLFFIWGTFLIKHSLDEKQEKNVKEHNKGNVAYLIILFIVIFILTRFIMLAFMRIG